MKKWIGVMGVSTLLLTGCFGGSPDKEDEVFNPKKFLTNEEMEQVYEKKEGIIESHEEKMKQMDYVIKDVLSGGEDVDFYYTDTLSKDSEEVLRLQWLYFDVHKQNMRRLSEQGAGVDELIYHNRQFGRYLEIFKGKKYKDVEFMKSILEKHFTKYEVSELEALTSGKDIGKFIDGFEKWEDGLKIREWYKDEENLDYTSTALVQYNVVPEEIKEEDREAVGELVSHYNEMMNVVEVSNFNGLNRDTNINTLKTDIQLSEDFLDSVVLSKDIEWMSDRLSHSVDYYKTYVSLLEDGKDFEALDHLQLYDVEDKENKVSMFMIEKMLEKGEKDKEEEKETKETNEEGKKEDKEK